MVPWLSGSEGMSIGQAGVLAPSHGFGNEEGSNHFTNNKHHPVREMEHGAGWLAELHLNGKVRPEEEDGCVDGSGDGG